MSRTARVASAAAAGPYSPGDVAELFGVDPKTVTRWERAGKLPGSFRTLGGHRRYDRAAIDALRTGSTDHHERTNA